MTGISCSASAARCAARTASVRAATIGLLALWLALARSTSADSCFAASPDDLATRAPEAAPAPAAGGGVPSDYDLGAHDTQPRPSDEEARAVHEYMAWTHAIGIRAPKVRVAWFRYPGVPVPVRGLMATERIAPNETVITVPSSAIITPSNLENSVLRPHLRDFADWPSDNESDRDGAVGEDMLVSFAMGEHARGRASAWWPWLELVYRLDFESFPTFWNVERLAREENDVLTGATVREAAVIARSFRRLERVLRALLPNASLDDLRLAHRRAYTLVSSRNFVAPLASPWPKNYRDSSGSDYYIPPLVVRAARASSSACPAQCGVIDQELLNTHASDAERGSTRDETDPQTGELRFVAERAFTTGEEITHLYISPFYCREKWQVFYGFAPNWAKPCRCARGRTSAAGEESNAEEEEEEGEEGEEEEGEE